MLMLCHAWLCCDVLWDGVELCVVLSFFSFKTDESESASLEVLERARGTWVDGSLELWEEFVGTSNVKWSWM